MRLGRLASEVSFIVLATRHGSRVLAAVLGVVALHSSPAQANDRLLALWQNHGPLVFAAAASTDSVFRDLGVEALGSGWESWDFAHLAPRLDVASLDGAFEKLSAGMRARYSTDDGMALDRMELWVGVYRALETLEEITGPEAFASAVALVPATAAEFPRDQETVERFGKEAGTTLAAAEISGLKVQVSTRLSKQDRREIGIVIRDLYAAALDVEEDP